MQSTGKFSKTETKLCQTFIKFNFGVDLLRKFIFEKGTAGHGYRL